MYDIYRTLYYEAKRRENLTIHFSPADSPPFTWRRKRQKERKKNVLLIMIEAKKAGFTFLFVSSCVCHVVWYVSYEKTWA
jgi:hypothetical protein